MKSGIIVALVCLLSVVSHPAPPVVVEPAHTIPVTYDVDVVVVGGTSGAVAAAAEAARSGASVFLAAPRPYLGADMCGTYRLWLEEGKSRRLSLRARCTSSRRLPDIQGRQVHLSCEPAFGSDAQGLREQSEADGRPMDRRAHAERAV